ncbi:metal-dependent hydrolase [Microbacterium sp. APC 3898]|uniref:Metal-dependent hydrolase n=2 Tax=Planococcus TaxID=1372 RepID=A0ABT7ZKL3_9BACL|nr:MULTISPECIES: metal-dependent hydrolase [Terrabacteria group]MBD8014816.1 metal-dependent hydrolase [Planococcus wigleyi]MDN3427702.1 metal-dependent hydrolase [Planococcus sp. APC 4016]MDN3437057.1 metal-dependent hydrolase [Planococcus sp. APC 3900]MDN3499254.1 metal-dependent hydrolase [Microbacterium sp. APC 3898]
MTGKTHILGGITASLAFAQITNYEPVLLLGAGVIGSVIPDICHGSSKIGRALPVLSKLINGLFGHRTFTHSLLFLVLFAVLLNNFMPVEAISAGLLVGMASHIVLDMATKRGVKLFFPFKWNVRFPVTATTGGTSEYLVFALLSLLSVYFGYGVFIPL